MHDVERIADRFGFINKGELLTVRSPRELAAERADFHRLRYQAAAALTPSCVECRTGEFECELVQRELPEFIARLNGAGGHLLGVKPAVSLETVFFRTLEEAAARRS
ncbi:hypothetical protein D3C80_1825900 [compost metagenome]